MTTQFTPTQAALEAVIASIVLRQGEPLTDPAPPHVAMALSRPDIERASGRRLRFDYEVTDLNPFGALIIRVED